MIHKLHDKIKQQILFEIIYRYKGKKINRWFVFKSIVFKHGKFKSNKIIEIIYNDLIFTTCKANKLHNKSIGKANKLIKSI